MDLVFYGDAVVPVAGYDHRCGRTAKDAFSRGEDISDRFVGTVHRNDLIEADDVYQVPQTNVITFEPGSYSGWHAHGAMTVIGVAGQGIYQEWGKDAVRINPGDVVEIPAGVSHFHGAVKDFGLSANRHLR